MNLKDISNMILRSMPYLVISWICFAIINWVACTPKTGAGERQEGKQIQSRIGEVPLGDGGPYKMTFINDRDGWLAQGRFLWRTMDGGTSWSPVFVAGQKQGPSSLASAYLPGGLYVITSNIVMFQFGDEVYRTEDGGKTWFELSDLPLEEPAGFRTCFKFVSDGRRGWMGGGIYQRISVEQANILPKAVITERDLTYAINAVIYVTQNGGLTWRRQQLPNTLGPIKSLYFYDDQHGLALSLYQVFYTNDAGRRWTKVNLSPTCVDNKRWSDTADERYPVSAFVSSTLGLLAYRDGYMAKSTDGGASWCDFLQPGEVAFEHSYDFLSSIHFVDSERGFGLAGYRMYQTNDGGRTWIQHALDAHLDVMTFADARVGWAVGRDGLFRINP